jgi:hypothetical protein
MTRTFVNVVVSITRRIEKNVAQGIGNILPIQKSGVSALKRRGNGGKASG